MLLPNCRHVARYRLKPPVTFYIILFYINDRSRSVLLIWFYVFACIGVSFCTVFIFFVSS